ncbi:MAG: cytochrome b [Gammaproteobacteria bacterium]|nr:cytochrome b [Gammaproteobacteria bacterium]
MDHRLSKTTLFLHWMIAINVIGLLIVGLIMHENKIYSLYPIHKSVGMLILPLALFRVYWRIKEKWPAPIHQLSQKWIRLSHISHISLLSLTLLMPITGMLMSIFSGRGLSLFSVPLIMAQQNSEGEFIELSKTWAEITHQMHFLFSDMLLFILSAHITAALIHHFFLKDNVLRRIFRI